ncbi:hypothetical protein BJX70DRAFT_366256 [Aspergillus crustosus]
MTNSDPYRFKNHTLIPPSILTVVTTILRSWDNPLTDYAYVTMFHPHGTLDVHTTPATGHDEIHALHAQMIDPVNGPVVRVQHHFEDLFLRPGELEGGPVEAVFNGVLVTVLKNGVEVETGFASLVKMSPSKEDGDGDGELRADYLRAYIDRSRVVEEIGKMLSSGKE